MKNLLFRRRIPCLNVARGILLVLLIYPGCRRAKDRSFEAAMDRIFQHYEEAGTPGCAVEIVHDRQVVFSKGYGLANLEHRSPVLNNTVFYIASVSKQFTGYAISTLIQQGKISEDADIHQYLSWVPDFGRGITVRHLLHHTSGLRDWPEALHAAGWRWDDVFSYEDIVRMVKHQRDLDFEPGARESYSNTGYNLLAAIVEKVSGKKFTDWTEENIFSPLGMSSSHFQSDYHEIIPNLAYSYESSGSGYRRVFGPLTAYGSSSLFTSVDDLGRWVISCQKMMEEKNPVFLRMLSRGTLNNGDTVFYGYGLAYGFDRGLPTVSHTGGWAGYRTIIMHYPEQKLSIIILSNSGDFDPTGYAEKVADYFLKDQFKQPEKNIGDLPTVKPDPALLKKYEGIYELGPGWEVTLTFEDGQLMTQATGESKFPMTAKSDSVFWIDAYHAAMTFVKDKDGSVNTLKYKSIIAKRIEPVQSDPHMISRFAGTYYSPELLTEYSVTTDSGKLAMHHFHLGDIALLQDIGSADQFLGDLGLVRFTRDSSSHEVSGFLLSGGRVKNLRFDKKR